MIKFSDKVLEFATKAHADQKRKYSGLDYITHPIAVAEILVKDGRGVIIFDDCDIEMAKSIAYLHDVLEDTKVSEKELNDFLLETIGYELTVRIIMDAVKLVTKKKIGFDLFEYLDGIKTSVAALELKLADLKHNMSDLKDSKKMDYYKLIKYYLEH